MTFRSQGGLSFEELERIETSLQEHGYRLADENAGEMGPYEYCSSRTEGPVGTSSQLQGYSICWRK